MKETLKPEPQLIVIAEDHPPQRVATAENIRKAFSDTVIVTPTDLSSFYADALESALIPGGRRQADIVLLDQDYSRDIKKWDVNNGLLAAMLKNLLLPEEMQNSKLPTDSIYIALALRLYGYSGRIIEYSSGPYQRKEIISRLERHNLSQRRLFDGQLSKNKRDNFQAIKLFEGASNSSVGRRVQYSFYKTSHSEALRRVILGDVGDSTPVVESDE